MNENENNENNERNNKIIIYLIRHGQSEENVKINLAKEGLNSIKNFNLPKKENVIAGFKLLGLHSDEPLSNEGKRQVENVSNQILNDNFLIKHQPELHIHSPLQRARDTHHGLFPTVNKVELECLRELTPTEYIFSRNGLKHRIEEFENWLNERNESSIVVVGHSQYFKMMLNADSFLDNCSVLKCTFHKNREGRDKWESHEILYSLNELIMIENVESEIMEERDEKQNIIIEKEEKQDF